MGRLRGLDSLHIISRVCFCATLLIECYQHYNHAFSLTRPAGKTLCRSSCLLQVVVGCSAEIRYNVSVSSNGSLPGLPNGRRRLASTQSAPQPDPNLEKRIQELETKIAGDPKMQCDIFPAACGTLRTATQFSAVQGPSNSNSDTTAAVPLDLTWSLSSTSKTSGCECYNDSVLGMVANQMEKDLQEHFKDLGTNSQNVTAKATYNASASSCDPVSLHTG